ncbi:Transcription factor TFIIIB component B'' -like protein [Halotydeus destructor]|nr:Transcription factor TFIIIB component B'' -like protein [Halotydeus destructor]
MIRRAKVQFKPKIQASGDRSKTPQAADNAAEPKSKPAAAERILTTTIELVDTEDTDIEDEADTGQSKDVEEVVVSSSTAEVVVQNPDQSEPELQASEIIVVEKPKENAPKAKPREKEQRRTLKRPKIVFSSSKAKLPLDKSKATMFDLLSYNPPMNDDQKEKKRKKDDEELSMAEEEALKSPEPEIQPPPKEEQGPRVKVGPDGTLIIDEESLVVHKPVIETSTVVEGRHKLSSVVTYSSFRTRQTGKKTRWTDDETLRFYKALTAVGTDFTLMSDLLFQGERTRLDLKNKFKKEEKINRKLVDKALSGSDLSLMDEFYAGSENESVVSQNVQPEIIDNVETVTLS